MKTTIVVLYSFVSIMVSVQFSLVLEVIIMLNQGLSDRFNVSLHFPESVEVRFSQSGGQRES